MATTNAPTYTLDLDRLDGFDLGDRSGNPRKRRRGRLFFRKFTIAITAAQVAVNEVVNLILFPADCYMVALAGHITDVDTNATPTHQMKLTIGGDDITTGITAGQAGGRLLTDAQMSDWFALAARATADAPNVSAQTLSMTSTTGAATAAAGTLTLFVVYSRGVGAPL